MKRTTLMIVAAFVFAVTMAQPSVKHQKVSLTEKAGTQRTALKLTPEAIAKVNDEAGKGAVRMHRQQAQTPMSKMQKARGPHKALKKKVSREDAGIIIEQPAGKCYDMVYDNYYYGYNWLYGFYGGHSTGKASKVVEGDDGCIYIHNLITELSTESGYWVKAERTDGDNIVIHPQPIYEEYDSYSGETYTYYITRMVFDPSGSTFVVEEGNTDIYMTWKDGKLRTAAEYNTGGNFNIVVSCVDGEGYWSGAFNWDINMYPQTDVAITELPEGVTAEDLVMKYEDDYGNTLATKVKFAISGNDAYLQLTPDLNSWVKGTINGTKITFDSRQYLGLNEYYSNYIYFIAAMGELIANSISFTYDAAAMTLTSNLTIYVNEGKTSIYYLNAYSKPYIFRFVEKPATPVTPEISEVMNFTPNDNWGGYGYIDFDASYFDANGEYLNPDLLTYKVYIDDKEFTLTPEDYYELDEPLTEIPYEMSDLSIYYQSGSTFHEVQLFQYIGKNVGVQLIYHVGGEVYASEIAWYEVDNTFATGAEGFAPNVEESEPNGQLAAGEMAINLGAVEGNVFGSTLFTDEHYDVAFHLVDPTLVGKQITAINVPFFDTTGITGTKVWLSTSVNKLDENGTFVPDVVSQEFTANKGFTQVKLPEPYTITADGIYVGYSLDQAIDMEGAEYPTPIVLTSNSTNGGFLIHTNKAYRSGFFNMYEQFTDLALEVVFTGADANAAAPRNIQSSYIKAGEIGNVKVNVTNLGYNGLKSIDYSYEVAGMNGTAHFDLSPALAAVYGTYRTMNLPLPAIAERGTYPISITIDKVNGEPNTAAEKTATGKVMVLTTVPTKRPLMEEYTGTWCGYCPRGYIGLEKMASLYPDDFVGIAYHNGDPMEFTTQYPNKVEGFPDAWLDRVYETDAYVGDYNTYTWGLEEVWLKRRAEFAPADISVIAEWADDTKQTINATSFIQFAFENDTNPYTVAYALIANGLSGDTQDWDQANNYSGAENLPEDFRIFTEGESYVSGLEFNHVLVARSSVSGDSNTLPDAIKVDAPYTHSYSFNTNSVINSAGQPIIQDKNKLEVVIMLIDKNTGEVVNANKAKVMDKGTGIASTNTDKPMESVAFYDLAGRKVSVPVRGGIYIKSVRYKDGQVSAKKVLIQ